MERFSIFQNLRAFNSAQVDYKEIVRLIEYDQSVTDKQEAYRKMKQAVGKKTADEEVKVKLMPGFAPTVLFDGVGRNPQNILGFTGCGLCDLDHVKNVEAVFQQVSADEHTLLAYSTIGGEGLRIIYRYQTEHDGEHLDETSWRAAFLKANSHYAELTGCDYDPQCSAFTAISGLAHDPHVYTNTDAQPFVVTDEEILAASFSPDSEPGKPRKEHPTGSFTVSVDEAWPKVEKALAKKHLSFTPGHHHNYVMHAAFLFNRFGTPLDELLDWAAQEWALYDPKQLESTIRSCYKKTNEHGTWKLRQTPGRKKQNSLASLAEISRWLDDNIQLEYNAVNERTYFRYTDQDDWQEVDQRDICTFRRNIEADTGKRTLKSDVSDVIFSDQAKQVHAMQDYVAQLPQWDGTDRVRQLTDLFTITPVGPEQTAAEAHDFFHWATHKWLVATLAGWIDKNVSNHEILTLIGPQGIFKTTSLSYLLPPQLRSYFHQNIHCNFKSKDDRIALSEKALVDLEEISLTESRDLGDLKAVASSLIIDERHPYGKQRKQKKRIAALCATGNEQAFLVDETGNRRWLCFLVERIVQPRDWTIDYDQLYAQLYAEYRQGFQYWFDDQEQLRVEAQNEAFRIMSDEEQLIRTHFRKPKAGEPCRRLNAAGIIKHLNGGRMGFGLSTKKVGAIMKRLKIKPEHTEHGNLYRVFVIPYNDLNAQTVAQPEEPVLVF